MWLSDPPRYENKSGIYSAIFEYLAELRECESTKQFVGHLRVEMRFELHTRKCAKLYNFKEDLKNEQESDECGISSSNSIGTGSRMNDSKRRR